MIKMKNVYWLILVALLIHATFAWGAPATVVTSDLVTKGPWVDVRAFANLSTAVASTQSAGKTILVPNEQNVNDLTIPSDRAIEVIKGGLINVATGKTLTITGPLGAGPYKIFSGSGSIVLGPQTQPSVEWFGAGGAGSNGAIQRAINTCLASGIPVLDFMGSDYGIDATLTIATQANGAAGLVLRGRGSNLTTISMSANAPILYFDGNADNQTTNANARSQINSGVIGIRLRDKDDMLDNADQIGVKIRGLHRFIIDDVFIHTVGGTGIKSFGVAGAEQDTDALMEVYISKLRIRYTGAEGIKLTANRGGLYKIDHSKIEMTTGNGIELAGSSIALDTVTVSLCGRRATQTGGLRITRCDSSGNLTKNVRLENMYYEANAYFDVDVANTRTATLIGSEHAPLPVLESGTMLNQPEVAFIRFGVLSDAGNLVQNALIDGVQINGFPDENLANIATIKGVEIGQYCLSCTVDRVISDTLVQIFPLDRQVSISTSASQVVEKTKAVAKAAVTFTVTGGVVTVNQSYNVSTVTRNAAGDYTVTFERELSDNSYQVTTTCGDVASLTGFRVAGYYNKNTTGLNIYTTNMSTQIDATQVTVQVF